MVDRQIVTLNSNWSSLPGTDLCSSLIDNPSNTVEIDIENLSAENCVCLQSSKNTDHVKPYLEIEVKGCITDIGIVSEAQVIEVFGVKDEYLLTHTSELIDDWQDMAVYYAKISLPRIPVCKLKFTRARNEDRLWIFGIKIQVQKLRIKQFNLEQIVRLMGNPQASSPNNGNNLSKMMQFYFKNSPNNSSGVVLQHETEPNVNGKNEEICVSDKTSKLQVNEIWLKRYIDKKFLEMKEDILCQIDLRLNNLKDETNCKLDKIISILENRVRMEN